MKKKLLALVLAGATLVFASCASNVYQPVVLGVTTQNIPSLSGSVIGSGRIVKSGESCSYSIALINYFFYGPGNSLQAAMEKGGITKVGVVDHSSIYWFLPFVAVDCVVVYGE